MTEFFGRRGRVTPIPESYNQATRLQLTKFNENIAIAFGRWTSGGFLLKKGSLIQLRDTLQSNPGVRKTKNKLIEIQLLKEFQPGWVELMTDIYLSSPSTAARLVQGQDSNGWVAWQNSNGVTLGELLDQKN